MKKKDAVDRLNSSALIDRNLAGNLNKSFEKRPVSVNLTRPEQNKTSNTRNNFINQAYPIIYQQNSFIIETSPNFNFTKIKHTPSNIDKEKLYQDNINLKNIINSLKQELANVRSEVHKKDLEISRKNKELEDINYEINLNVNAAGVKINDPRLQNKIKETSLVNNLKIQLKEVNNELKNKINEFELIKKNVKVSKISELSQELRITVEEFKKFKELYIQAELRSREAGRIIDENLNIQDKYNKLHFEFLSIKENLRKTEEDLQKKELDILKLRQTLNEKDGIILKTRKDMSILNQKTENMNKNTNNQYLEEKNKFSSKIKLLEKTISELSKDCKFYKDLSEKKEEVIKNLEKMLSGNIYEGTEDNILAENPTLNNSRFQDLNLENRENISKTDNVEDDLKAFTYIILKNLQAKRIDRRKLKEIFEVNVHKNGLENEIASRICLTLNIKNQNEKKKIHNYVSTIYLNDKANFKNKFLTLYDGIPSYPKQKEEFFQTQLLKELYTQRDYLKNTLLFYDKEKTGFITFHHLKKVLDIIQVNLKSEYVEYLIYFMKDFESTEKTLLEQLNYQKLIDLLCINLAESNEKSFFKLKNETINEMIVPPQNFLSQNSIGTLGGVDHGEIIISNEEYNQRVNDCLTKLSKILIENRLTLRQFFKESIFSHEITDTILFEAIALNNFINDLSKYKIELDKRDAFCVLNKFKYLEEYESIDVMKLITEMNKYGLTDENVQSNSEFKDDDINLFKKLNKFLHDNEVEIDDIFLNKIKKIEINKGEEPKPVIEINEFTKILKGFKILDSNSNLSDYLLSQICDKNNQYVIQENLISLYKKHYLNLPNKEEKEEYQIHDSEIQKKNNQQSENNQGIKGVLDEISENIEPTLGGNSPVKNYTHNNPFQNFQSFAFSHKPTFGNLHVYENNMAEHDESLNINELEKELDSEGEKFDEIK